MADSETTQVEPETQGQVTSKTPTMRPAKNLYWVASRKAVAAKTKQAHKEPKKAAEVAVAAGLIPPLSESKSIVASTDEVPKEDTKNIDEVPKEDTKKVDEAPKEDMKKIINTTQWIGIISIVVSVIGIYYKREEIKKVFNREPVTPQPAAEMQAPVDTQLPQPVQRRQLLYMD